VEETGEDAQLLYRAVAVLAPGNGMTVHVRTNELRKYLLMSIRHNFVFSGTAPAGTVEVNV